MITCPEKGKKSLSQFVKKSLSQFFHMFSLGPALSHVLGGSADGSQVGEMPVCYLQGVIYIDIQHRCSDAVSCILNIKGTSFPCMYLTQLSVTLVTVRRDSETRGLINDVHIALHSLSKLHRRNKLMAQGRKLAIVTL